MMQDDSSRKIGYYYPCMSKGKQKWVVVMNKDDWYYADTQTEAEILSRLVVIEKLLTPPATVVDLWFYGLLVRTDSGVNGGSWHPKSP